MQDSSAAAPPKIFISYSHDSDEHKDRVLELSNRFRQDGVDATIDQYEVSPPEGWPKWMERQIRESDFVLIVCTEVYLKRTEGREEPGKGHGVIWESVLTYQQIYDAGSRNERFVPVLLEGGELSHIPAPLKSATSYECATEDGYWELYARLTDQHGKSKPELGKLKSLPARDKKQQVPSPKPTQEPVSAASQLGENSALWYVPHDRNPVFTGRIDALETLRNDLLKNGWQALHGLGGIGKTQIAVEYVYRHRQEYSAVFWVFAESEQSLITSFIQIAHVLNLPVKDLADQAVIVGAVKRWLGENEGWLLVFDNADPPGVVRQFVPAQRKGHILLTSRAHDFQVLFQALPIIEPLEVIELPVEAAREFLLKRTGRKRSAYSEGDVDAVTKELGYFPLALEQAGAFIYENQTSFEDYLKSFRKRRLELLEKRLPVMGGYKGTVATTWAMNFAEVEKTPASADLLRLSAFLSPAMIPLELLERGKAELGEPLASQLQTVAEDPVALDELLKPVTDYSLIRRNISARSYSIHPLVQEVVRANMAPDAHRSWAERTARMVNTAFPDPDFKNWPDCERLLSHALLSSKHVSDYNFEFSSAATLLRNAGFYLHERGQYDQAQPLYEQALAIRERMCGPEHPDTADSLNKMAWLHDDQGRYAKAELLCKRALEINEKALGSEHPATLTSLSDLAKIYHDQERFGEAESLCRRALAIREKIQPDHRDTVISLNNLAGLFQKQQRYGEAEPLFERALGISERVSGPEHPATATSLNNLAGLYVDQGRLGEAEPLFERALEISERGLGPEHPDTANNLHNLASLYQDQQRYDEAQPLLEHALKIKERVLGREHPATAVTLGMLARLYRDQGKFKLAEPLFSRAYIIREKALGLTHPDTIDTLQSLAALYRRWGRVREAHKYEKMLKQIQRKKHK
ncbi:MAG TPA: tetratricopeptide repeat protein [Candidatus Angelobacter sp.]|nr:tetratricopeptide repeat protein [Candidatus Angelobacter sp.]